MKGWKARQQAARERNHRVTAIDIERRRFYDAVRRGMSREDAAAFAQGRELPSEARVAPIPVTDMNDPDTDTKDEPPLDTKDESDPAGTSVEDEVDDNEEQADEDPGAASGEETSEDETGGAEETEGDELADEEPTEDLDPAT